MDKCKHCGAGKWERCKLPECKETAPWVNETQIKNATDDWRDRHWHIEYVPKPIPDRRHDFDFWHDDYDGAPDSGDNRCGTAESVEDALEQIREIENG